MEKKKNKKASFSGSKIKCEGLKARWIQIMREKHGWKHSLVSIQIPFGLSNEFPLRLGISWCQFLTWLHNPAFLVPEKWEMFSLSGGCNNKGKSKRRKEGAERRKEKEKEKKRKQGGERNVAEEDFKG